MGTPGSGRAIHARFGPILSPGFNQKFSPPPPFAKNLSPPPLDWRPVIQVCLGHGCCVY